MTSLAGLPGGAKPTRAVRLILPAARPGSGARDDRGRLEGINHRIGRRSAPAATVEEYSPFESARTQKRIGGQNPVTHRRQMRSHQPNRLDEARIRSRLAPAYMQGHT